MVIYIPLSQLKAISMNPQLNTQPVSGLTDSGSSGPADSNVIDRARAEAFFPEGSDTSWLKDPGIIASRLFAAQFTKDKERNWGNVLQCTHYLEVANWVHNCPELRHVRDGIAAFVGYNHDLGEDFREDIQPPRIVDACWRGSPEQKEYVLKALMKLTDPEDVSGKARLRAQIDAAQNSGDLVNYVRFADKWCSILRDLWCLQNDKKVFSDIDDKNEYFEYLRRRNLVVQNLRVDDKYKVEFLQLNKRIESIAERQLAENNVTIQSLKHYAPQLTRQLCSKLLLPVALTLRKVNSAVNRATGIML